MNVYDKVPYVHKDAFIAPSASITGDVQIGHASSIWYGCVLRGKPTKPFYDTFKSSRDNRWQRIGIHRKKDRREREHTLHVAPTLLIDGVSCV